ncbi:High-potential iron-sulfur protein [Thauera sp. GDN1]|jgi:hypothetical protein|uniref:high-potential iron-sulfur protein n=1 Tax=Thauera sp. GDN1 TaxID=2944810 RepID=UPI002478D176|nr:high-potential iron-sulfur protein [Thauera sp. GDN1]WEN42499.1 High-potential iron-sulfur protein [Thauera sp. GDN1]
MDQTTSTRRKFIKMTGVLAVIPLVAAAGSAHAARNSAMRSALKYQETPMGEKKCATCYHFVPGADANSLGGCKMFPGDDEVSPNAYCAAWALKK